MEDKIRSFGSVCVINDDGENILGPDFIHSIVISNQVFLLCEIRTMHLIRTMRVSMSFRCYVYFKFYISSFGVVLIHYS